MSERQLPKLHTRVRFPSPAPYLTIQFTPDFPNGGVKKALRTVVRFVFLPCPWKYQWQSE